jgi:hypothetical protein
MKNRLGKTGLIMLTLVLALAITGAGFAKWSDTVTIEGTVNTGTVKVGIYDVGTYDPGPNFLEKGGALFPEYSPKDGTADPAYKPGHNEEGKNVASHNSENDGEYVCTKVIWGEKYDLVTHVTETIANAYPYYKSGTTLLLGNCGTIPVRIDDINLKYIDGNETLLDYLTFLGAKVVEFDENGKWVTDFGVEGGTWKNLEEALYCYQLEPCHTLWVDFGFYFEEKVNKVMPQGAKVSFTIDVTCSQWNEVH